MRSKKIAVIGLGYVGLPLAVEFGKNRAVVGYDFKQSRIDELRDHQDSTLEVTPDELKQSQHLSFTNQVEGISDCEIFIIAVPTPVDNSKRPNLSALRAVSEKVGKIMPKGSIVIYESTVYPGCTRETCVPILEKESGFTFNKDFFVGYSPERANPGDKEHRVTTITKVTSGSTPEIADEVDALYREIVVAGTHKASSIEVAEAAKVIENTQRDLNIALMNELALIFERMNIDTLDVLEAAGTKWNFLPFRPGLVGGHCIGVDPYYLTYKAQDVGYHPEVILAGRRINDGMSNYVADHVCRLMMKKSISVLGSRILVMGATFKENCPDTRNSKVVGVISRLKEYNVDVDIYDPWIDREQFEAHTGYTSLTDAPSPGQYDAIIIAVGHKQFKAMGVEKIHGLGKANCVVYDLKSLFPACDSDGRL